MSDKMSKDENVLDYENRQRTERLAQKIVNLKNFAIDIEVETKEHNKLLDNVDNDFDSTWGFLHNGRNRINRLLHSGSGNRKIMCYLSIVLTIFILVIYYFMSKVITSTY